MYARITGWGQSGRLAPTAGHDINYVALTGALDAIGHADGTPVPPLNLVGDYGGGALYGVIGVLAAMMHSRASGAGQVVDWRASITSSAVEFLIVAGQVDCAIVDGAASLMSAMYAWRTLGIVQGGRGRNQLDGSAPFFATYRCADGPYIAVGSMEEKFHLQMCRLIGVDEAQYSGRNDPQQWVDLKGKLQTAFAQRTHDECDSLLSQTDACCAPVLRMEEAPAHPHLADRETLVEWQGRKIPGPAPRFSLTPSVVDGSELREREAIEGVVEGWSRQFLRRRHASMGCRDLADRPP